MSKKSKPLAEEEVRRRVGLRLEEARKRCGYTRRQVAGVLTVTVPTLFRWERGEWWPSPWHLLLLEWLYALESGELWRGLVIEAGTVDPARPRGRPKKGEQP